MSKDKFDFRKKVFGRAGLFHTAKNSCFPLLEGISSERFEIEEGSVGRTDNRKRVVRVPLDDSDRSRRVRVHEMAHAVVSPDDYIRPSNIHKMAMQRAEDMRCNAWNEDIGHSELQVALSTKKVIDKHVIEPLGEGDKLAGASAAMGTKGTKDYDKIIGALKDADEKWGSLVEEFVDARWEVMHRHSKVNDAAERQEFAGGFEESIVNAEMLMELVETEEMPSDAYCDGEPSDGDDDGEKSKGSGADGDDDADGEGDGDGDGGDDANPAEGKVGKGEYKKRARGKMVKDMDKVDDSAFGWSAKEAGDEEMEDGEERDEMIEEHLRDMSKIIYPGNSHPGPMEIVEPSRQYRLPGSMEGRIKRPADIGRVPQHMNRFASDKQIFTETGKRPGGCTVLIDDSGSMSLSIEEIETILYLMPAATIAAYCGRSTSGRLVILAKNGRRISQQQYRDLKVGGSNIVDIPALEWLCKHPGPRYWISDAYITGVGDGGMAPEYYDYVRAMCRKYKIYRIPCVGEKRREEFVRYGHEGHIYSLEGIISGGKRRRKIKHKGHMLGGPTHDKGYR